jgi:natural product precursor
MKTKSFGKKLVLNKSTISNLDHSEMKGIKGGTVPSWTWCWETCNCWTAGCPTWSRTPDCPE